MWILHPSQNTRDAIRNKYHNNAELLVSIWIQAAVAAACEDVLGSPISTGVSGMSGSAVGSVASVPLSSSTSPSTSL